MKIHPSTPNRHLSKGFTLLEIVIVLGIIAVIMGGSIYGLKKFLDGSKIQRADQDMMNLSAAVMNYRSLAGFLPTTQQGLEALYVKPTTPPIPKRHASVGKSVPIDPWGNPYRYRNPGKKDPSDFEIYTFGPDGIENTNDDMSSQD